MKTNIDIDRLDDMYRIPPAEREWLRGLLRQTQKMHDSTEDESMRQAFKADIKYITALLQRRSLREELEEDGWTIQIVPATEGSA